LAKDKIVYIVNGFNGLCQKRANSYLNLPALDYIGRFDFFYAQVLIIDANIIDKARKECPCIDSFAGSNIEQV